jgi:hypothetical protein
MQVVRDLVPSVLRLVSPQSQLRHLNHLRAFMVKCASIPELEPQMMPLCEALIDIYRPASAHASAHVASSGFSLQPPAVSVAS